MTRKTWWGAVVAVAAGAALACTGSRSEQRGTPTAGTVGPTGAPVSAEPASPPQEQATVLPQVSGRVTGVEGDTLRVQQEGKEEIQLRIDPTLTSIEVDGRQASLGDLQPGTEVRASYDERDGAKNAVTVQARTGGAMGGEMPQGTGTSRGSTAPSTTAPSTNAPPTTAPPTTEPPATAPPAPGATPPSKGGY